MHKRKARTRTVDKRTSTAEIVILSLAVADCGDYVVVTNARQVVVTGKKAEQKVYRGHSQFPGGLKEVPYARMMERKPDEVCVDVPSSWCRL